MQCATATPETLAEDLREQMWRCTAMEPVIAALDKDET
jgi:hypothetical protein